jgi:murein L,D-transpeptidase YcbB/YkuD
MRSTSKQDVLKGFIAVAIALIAAALFFGNRKILVHPRPASANEIAVPQKLGPEGEASLRSIVSAANLAILRWPDFSDYRALVSSFYESYGYSLPWMQDMHPTDQALQVIELLKKADEKGLSAEDYDGSKWAGRLAALAPAKAQPAESDAVQFDTALTVSVMRYISDLHIGKVNPKHFDFGIDIERKKYNLPDFVREDVVGSSDISGALSHVEPPLPGYKRTIRALAQYEQIAKEDAGGGVPSVAMTVAPGDTYAGIPRMAQLLHLEGDLPVDSKVPADQTSYQEPLVSAVRKYQTRHGITPDGRLTAQTIAAMNVPYSSRVRQIDMTLERWRWLPVSIDTPPIVVNIPEFRLRAYDQQMNPALTMNVVVGKAYNHSTPVFIDSMQYVVFRPYWNVPLSIARAELLPGLQKDPAYLAKKGFQVVDAQQNVVAAGNVPPEMIQKIRSGGLFIRQNPGPKNSLGLVKFIFPNDYSVYMHDTPATEFFSRTRRDFSHGCIRLEKPADLAVWVLRDDPGWDMDRVRAAMQGKDNNQVNLVKRIPVFIIYGTVVTSTDGTVSFYDDIYGHDAALEKVLAKGYPYPSK